MTTKTYYEARVTYLAAARPQDELSMTHSESFRGKTVQEALDNADRYDEMPENPRKMYRDIDGEPVVVGYVYGLWQPDCDRSTTRKNYWQERWVEVVKVTEEYGVVEQE